MPLKNRQYREKHLSPDRLIDEHFSLSRNLKLHERFCLHVIFHTSNVEGRLLALSLLPYLHSEVELAIYAFEKVHQILKDKLTSHFVSMDDFLPIQSVPDRRLTFPLPKFLQVPQ